jgi:SPP1 gp7 family putative phage head morphogenesis protein
MQRLRSIKANPVIEAEYQSLLQSTIARMGKQYVDILRSMYERVSRPFLMQILRSLSQQWSQIFNGIASTIAENVAHKIRLDVDTKLRRYLLIAGSVTPALFYQTRPVRDKLSDIVANNVNLIKSIPQQYHARVQFVLINAIKNHQSLTDLTKNLQIQFGITERRAKLIASDQTGWASSQLQHERFAELGIKKAIWVYTYQSKEPRHQHIQMNGKTYDVRKGLWDRVEQAYIFPKQLIGCKCDCIPLII